MADDIEKQVKSGIGVMVLLTILTMIIGSVAAIIADPDTPVGVALAVGGIATVFCAGIMWGSVKGVFGSSGRSYRR